MTFYLTISLNDIFYMKHDVIVVARLLGGFIACFLRVKLNYIAIFVSFGIYFDKNLSLKTFQIQILLGNNVIGHLFETSRDYFLSLLNLGNKWTIYFLHMYVHY